MSGHFFEVFETFIRMRKADHLHFVELMLTDKAFGVLTIRTASERKQGVGAQ